MSNITKKIVASVTALTCAALLMGPGVALALTDSQIQSILDLLTSFGADTATVTNVEAALKGEPVTPITPTVEGCTITSFDRNLKQTMSGDDVNCLQIILNSASDTQLAESGVGSPGEETSYFGSLTKAAVIKFQEKYTEDVLAVYDLTEGTGYVGPTTRAKLNELLTGPVIPTGCECTDWEDVACGGGDCLATEMEQTRTCEPEEDAAEDVCEDAATTQCVADTSCVAGEGLTAALAADTPVATPVVGGSSIAELAKFTFVNGDAGAVKVTTLKFKRIGISDDTTLTSIYLFDGYVRLGDEATLSSGYATFNVADGIFTVPAGDSKTISVKADVANAAGQTVGIEIEAVTNVTSDASSVNGDFPLTGNLMSITAAPLTAGTVTLGAAAAFVPQANIDAVDDFIVWKNTLAVTQQNVSFEYLRLTQIGSISASDLANIRLDMSGTEIATSELVAGVIGQDLIFDLSAAPIAINKGLTKTLTVYADIVGGASKTMRLSLEKASDIFLKDAAFGCYVSVSDDVPSRTGLQTILQGTITMTKATDSPSGNVVNNSSNVSLAKFNVKANGEEIKINSLTVQIVTDDAETNYLRNGFLLLDGVQVGNTQVIATDENTSIATSTSFNIYQKIAAGTTKTLEVKADIYGCDLTTCTANVLNAAKIIQAKVILGVDNSQGMSSLNMIDAPGSDAPGTTLTVGTGALTLVINAAYGDQVVSAGSDTKIGSYNLTAGSYDTINASAFTVAVTESGAMALTDLSNIYLVYDGSTTAAKGTVTGSNVFSVTTALAPSQTITIDVWTTIDSEAAGALYTTLAVTATKATDGTAANAAATAAAQNIYLAIGALTVNEASDDPDSAIFTGLSTAQELAKYTFSSLFETFTISEAQIRTPVGTEDDFISLYVKYKNAAGETITSSAAPLISGVANFTGMTMSVPSGVDSDLTVYGNLNAVSHSTSTAYANSGDWPQLSLVYYKASSGSQPIVEGPALTEYNNFEIKAGGSATVAWSTTTTATGTFAAKLTAGFTGSDWAEIVLAAPTGPARVTLADMATITSGWSWQYYIEKMGLKGTSLELHFRGPGQGFAEMTIMEEAYGSQPWGTPTTSEWITQTVASTTTGVVFGTTATGTAISQIPAANEGTLKVLVAGMIVADSTAGAWVLTEVRPALGWIGASTTIAYIDDVTINGVSYLIEPTIDANKMLLYKTAPTVGVRAGITSGTLVNGVNNIYSLDVAADAKGDVGMKKITFYVSMGMTGATGDIANNFKFYRGSDDITSKVTITKGGGADLTGTTNSLASSTATTTIVTFNTEEVVTENTSQTYYLKANVTGVSAVGENIQTYIVDDTTYAVPAAYALAAPNNFVWTDKAWPSLFHGLTTADWLNGYLVRTLPTDTYTLSK